MNTQIEMITQWTKESFMGEKHRKEEHHFLLRLLAAFLGSLVFHLSLFVVGSTTQLYGHIANIVDNLIIFVMIYCLIFALCSASTRVGSLSRHFLTGAFLPGVTYWMSSIIILIVHHIAVPNS